MQQVRKRHQDSRKMYRDHGVGLETVLISKASEKSHNRASSDTIGEFDEINQVQQGD